MAAFVFDPDKDATNIAKHGVLLARAAEMGIVLVVPDLRRDYGENRRRAFGVIDGKLYCMIYVDRDQSVRVISLRRAGQRELRRNGDQSEIRAS